MQIQRFSPTDRTPSNLNQRQREFFRQTAQLAAIIPNGYVKMITWDQENEGYAKGFMQITPRPYKQGYGCDGSTDRNIHLIAATLCSRLGINYEEVYSKAYPKSDAPKGWVKDLLADNELRQETIIPEETGPDELMLVLSDLIQINNKSLEAVLCQVICKHGIKVDHWINEAARLTSWKLLADVPAPKTAKTSTKKPFRFTVAGIEFEAVKVEGCNGSTHWLPRVISTGYLYQSGVFKGSSRKELQASVERTAKICGIERFARETLSAE